MSASEATGWSRRQLLGAAVATFLLPDALATGSARAVATDAHSLAAAVVEAVETSPRLGALPTRDASAVLTMLVGSAELSGACRRVCGGDEAAVAVFVRQEPAERRRALRAVLAEAFSSSREAVRLAAIEADVVIRAVLGGLLPVGSPVCLESYEI